MKIIKDISENEMISTFLKAEINSDRWGTSISQLLENDGRNKKIIEKPDLTNETENIYRKQLLGNFRGYGNNAELFETFPNDVKWQLVLLSKEELEKVK